MSSVEPSVPFTVVALANYEARTNNELSLIAGQTYTVVQTDGQGLWWQAKSHNENEFAWFPASYTKYLPPVPPIAPKASAPLLSARTLTPTISPNNQSPRPSIPSPRCPPIIEKRPTPVYVKVQIVEAKGIDGSCDATAFIFRNKVLGVGPGDQIGHTSTVKKSSTPHWNEAFQVNVYDSETEIISIRLCNGKKFKQKGSDFLGEVHFPLRSSARDFESPNYQLRWYPLQGSNNASLLVFIQYHDTRPSQGPTNFKHESHLGWNADGTYDIANVPQAWKNVFTRVGITRKTLANNAQFAQEVVQIMSNYSDSQVVPTSSSTTITTSSFGSLQGAVPYSASSPYEASLPPYPSSSSLLPPLPPRRNSVITSSTTVTTFSEPSSEIKIEYATSVQVENVPPPPPPPSAPILGAGQPRGLLAEIRSASTLKPLTPCPPRPPPPPCNHVTEASLEIILRDAMKHIRVDISGYNGGDDEGEWE